MVPSSSNSKRLILVVASKKSASKNGPPLKLAYKAASSSNSSSGLKRKRDDGDNAEMGNTKASKVSTSVTPIGSSDPINHEPVEVADEENKNGVSIPSSTDPAVAQSDDQLISFIVGGLHRQYSMSDLRLISGPSYFSGMLTFKPEMASDTKSTGIFALLCKNYIHSRVLCIVS